MLMGTPVYMSPEQCRGLPEIDHRSDIYALGCVLFHLLTGRPPFEGEGPGDIISAHIREPAPVPSTRAPEIVPAVDALVLRCLAKAPAERFQTMVEVTGAIGSLLHQFPSGAPVNVPPGYALPTTRVPITGPPAPGGAFEASFGAHPTPTPPAVTPTTLGTRAGKFATSPPPRQRRIGLWIAAGLVVGAAGLGIAIVSMHGSESPRVASRPAEPTPAGSGMPSGSAPAVADAGAALPAKPASDAAEQVAVNAIDAGAVEAPAAPSAAEPVPPKTEAETPHAAPPARDPSRKQKRPRKPAPEPGDPSAAPVPTPPPPASKPAPPPAKPASSKCTKTAFAAVYNAVAPTREALEGALGTLRECHTSGAINDADFTQTRDALVAKLMAKS
jgi:serine/threonine-protein kinase